MTEDQGDNVQSQHDDPGDSDFKDAAPSSDAAYTSLRAQRKKSERYIYIGISY